MNAIDTQLCLNILGSIESTYYFAETVSVRCRLIVLQRRRANIRLPRLAVDDFNHTVTR